MSRYVDNVNKHDYQKVAAWFLGPKAENEQEFLELITDALHHHSQWRREYFPMDPPYIESEVKNSHEYKEQMHKIKEELEILNLRLRNSIPMFNSRYKGHMAWEVSMPGMLGYFAAMLYNQNNVAAEASAVTTVIEMEVADDLCAMLRFNSHFPVHLPEPSRISAPIPTSTQAVMNVAQSISSSGKRLTTERASQVLKKFLDKHKDVPKRTRGTPPTTVPEPYAWGHLTSCGSVANFEAAWAARNVKYLPYTIRKAIDIKPAQEDLYVVLANGTSKFLADLNPEDPDDFWALVNVPANNALDLLARYAEDLGGIALALDAVRKFSIQSVGILGIPGKRPEYFVPATAHYSWPKSGALLGLGEDSMTRIKVDSLGRMDVEALKTELNRCAAARIPVLFVVCVMGSTCEGAMDPIADVAEVRDVMRKDNGLDFFLHADAAWGGYCCSLIDAPFVSLPSTSVKSPARTRSFLTSFAPSTKLSDYVNDNLKQIHRADTITLDPHKAGYIQYPAGSICFQNKNMREMLAYKAPYISPLPGVSEDPSMGVYGIDGSRPGAAAVATYLHHRIAKLTPEGHGMLIGQANFNTKMLWSLLATMAKDCDPFIIGQIHAPKPADLPFLRKALKLSTNELSYHEDLVEVLRNNGPDFLINNFVVNYAYPVFTFRKETRTWNTRIDKAMDLMEAIGTQLNVAYAQHDADTTRPKGVSRKGLFIIRTTVFTETYEAGIASLTKSVNLKYDPKQDEEFSMLVSTNMEAWSTSKGFISIFESEMRQAILRGIGMLHDESAHFSFIAMEASGAELFVELVSSFRVPEYNYQTILTVEMGVFDPETQTYSRSENTKYDYIADYKEALATFPGQPLVLTTVERFTNQSFIYRESTHEWIEVELWVGTNKFKSLGKAFIRVSDLILNNHFDPAASYPVFGTADNIYASHVITNFPNYQEIIQLKTILPGSSPLLLGLGFEVTLLGVSSEDDRTKSPLRSQFGYPVEFVRANNEVYASSLGVQQLIYFSDSLNKPVSK